MAAIFAPILNSTAGLTLTPLQWERTKLSYFALDVVQLLQRQHLLHQLLQDWCQVAILSVGQYQTGLVAATMMMYWK